MKLVILTGAGMSAESGIKTFRDSDGLWENYRIEDVCTPEALERNPELVNHFYNERRKQLYEAQPNAGHKGLAGFSSEKQYPISNRQPIWFVRQIFSSLSVLHWPFIRQPVCCTMPPKVFRSSLSILRFLNKHTGWAIT